MNMGNDYNQINRKRNNYLAFGAAIAISAGSTWAVSQMDIDIPERDPVRSMHYTVRQGDTLDAILLRNSFRDNRHEYNLGAVRDQVKAYRDGEIRDIDNPDKIDTGDVLIIPVYHSPLGNKIDLQG